MEDIREDLRRIRQVEKLRDDAIQYFNNAEEILHCLTSKLEEKNIFYFCGLAGSCNYSQDDEVYHGKILGISDLITYEATTKELLHYAFEDAVLSHLKILEDKTDE